MKCAWHCCNNEVSGRSDKKFCNKKCCVKAAVAQNRKRNKAKAVELLGGKCSRCGYDRCLRALHFHHLQDKEFAISVEGNTWAWDKIVTELKKCILVCANCHAELHDGM